MIPFLTPKYIKQGKLYLKGARKKVAYNRDLWTAEVLQSFEQGISRLQSAVKQRDKTAIEGIQKELDDLCNEHCPLPPNPGISENVEVFLVAIIVALGIRTYFLQPFTIPTASMFPTLNGITGKRTNELPPNIAQQAWEFATYGRRYVNVIAKDDEQVTKFSQQSWAYFFTYTKLETDKGNVYWIPENMQATASIMFPVSDGEHPYNGFRTQLKKGQPIARGYFDTGDHVFVDKMSYHFRKPKRSEVFVFTTGKIQGIKSDFTQYYIKRLAGVPGDKLRVENHKLYIDGEVATEPEFQRVMNGVGYKGYSNQIGGYVVSPEHVFEVGPTNYFALGDNSYHSSDSRVWGNVPESDVVGPGKFVYWPFVREPGAEGSKSHFGLID